MATFDEIRALASRLTKATEPGPVVEWVQRIANVASESAVMLEEICWNQRPKHVAGEVTEFAESNGYFGTLTFLVEELERKNKG